MAGVLTSAIIAVSITVAVPGAPETMSKWSGMPGGTLGQVLTAWAVQAGQPKPVIDAEVARYKLGSIAVAARDYCEASGRVIAALRHSPSHPEIRDCGTAGAPLVVIANAGDATQGAR